MSDLIITGGTDGTHGASGSGGFDALSGSSGAGGVRQWRVGGGKSDLIIAEGPNLIIGENTGGNAYAPLEEKVDLLSEKHEQLKDQAMKASSELKKTISKAKLDIDENIRILQEQAQATADSLRGTNVTIQKDIDNLKKEKFQAVEMISTISGVIALVLVFTQTAIQFTHVWQAFVVLGMGVCSLILFANLIHRFFGSAKEEVEVVGFWPQIRQWGKDPLITIPFTFIAVIGIFSFITYIVDRPNTQQRSFERMEMEMRSISRPIK